MRHSPSQRLERECTRKKRFAGDQIIDRFFVFRQNMFVKIVRPILFITLICLSVLAIYSAITPMGPRQDFSFQNYPKCDFKISIGRILASASNFRHIKGFFVMSLLALIAFRKRRIFRASLYVAALTLLTEVLQMWSISRHCKVVDSIPNFLGLTFAIITFWLVSKTIFYYQKRKNAQEQI